MVIYSQRGFLKGLEITCTCLGQKRNYIYIAPPILEITDTAISNINPKLNNKEEYENYWKCTQLLNSTASSFKKVVKLLEDYNKYVEQIKDLNSVKTQIMNDVISVKMSELEEIFILFKEALKESLEINFSTYQVLSPLASKTHKKVKFPLLDKEDIADKVAKNSFPGSDAIAGEIS